MMRILLIMAALAFPLLAREARAACTLEIYDALPVAISGQIKAVVIDDACRYAYATNFQMNRVEVYNLTTRVLETPIAVGANPQGLDFSPGGDLLYVANTKSTYLSVVNLAQRREVAQVAAPGAAPAGATPTSGPYGVAVANTGRVLIGSTGIIYTYTPASGTVTRRTDFAYVSDRPILRASSDRSVIVIGMGNNSAGSLARYEARTDSITWRQDLYPTVSGSTYISDISLDAAGSYIFVNGQYLFDAGLNYLHDFGASAYGAVSPDRTLAYQGGGTVLDLTTFMYLRSLGGRAAGGPIDISRDGVIYAAVTSMGIVLVPAKATALILPRRTTVFSSAQTAAQSFLRITNTDSVARTVKVTLIDFNTGQPLLTWTSPSIAPGAAPQFGIDQIEAAATRSYSKPNMYVAQIESGPMTGTVANVLWRAADGTLTNLSTCDTGVAAITYRVANVHSRRIQAGYPSSIVVTNTGVTATSATLAVSDAATGARLGAFTTPAVPGHGAQTFTVDVIEAGARIPLNATAYHYVITLEGPFNGHLQHLVDNQQAGVLTDMSTVCVLAGPP